MGLFTRWGGLGLGRDRRLGRGGTMVLGAGRDLVLLVFGFVHTRDNWRDARRSGDGGYVDRRPACSALVRAIAQSSAVGPMLGLLMPRSKQRWNSSCRRGWRAVKGGRRVWA